MTCKDAIERLDDYVDGALSVQQAGDLERHLETCAECRRQERSLRELLEQAAVLPKRLQPGRDLWPGIAERIREPRRVVPIRRRWRPVLWNPALAAAALLLIALSSAVTAFLMRGSRGPAEVAESPSAMPQPAAMGTASDAIGDAEQEYERAAQALLASLEARRDSLSPETVMIVERNLEAIDAALRDVRRALEEDPGNPGLVRMLASTHRKRIRVLQTVVRHSRSL
jgi:hypothetical protein